MTLAEFLLARISEDEAMVPEAFRSRPPVWRTGWDVDSDMVGVDHARWLAECEAKRQIVELHRVETRTVSVWHDREDGLRQLVKATEFSCSICGWVGEEGPDPTGTTGCDTLRLLALPFADHPDLRRELAAGMSDKRENSGGRGEHLV